MNVFEESAVYSLWQGVDVQLALAFSVERTPWREQ